MVDDLVDRSCPVVSTTTAPPSARSGPSSARRCRAGRARRSPPRPRRRRRRSRATRRSARTRGDAVTYSFSAASGNTTEPMSRPSIDPAAACRRPTPAGGARSSARTAGLAATALTAVGDLAAADLGRGVDAVDEHTVVVDTSSVDRPGQLGDRLVVVDGRRRGAARRTPPPGTSPRCRGTRARAARRAPGRRCSCRRRPARRWRSAGRVTRVTDRSPGRPERQALVVAGGALHADHGPLVELARASPRRRRCTPNARRRRSGRGCPRRRAAPDRGTSATC